jgi:hypothetical protein
MYQFRFSVVENVTRVANSIGRSFNMAGRSAQSLGRNVDGTVGAVQRLDNRMNALTGTFQRVAGLAAIVGVGSLVKQGMNFADSLHSSTSLLKLMTGSGAKYNEVLLSSIALADKLGISTMQSLQGYSKMYTIAKGNVTEMEYLVKLSKALLVVNNKEDQEGAIFAIKELETGDTMSLRERFGIKVPTAKEAEKIADRDGKTIREVQFEALQKYFDDTYAGGQKGKGVDLLVGVNLGTIGSQISRISNSFKSMFTPALISFSTKFTENLKAVAGWVDKNKTNIVGWANVIAQVSIRAAALYGVFLGYQVLTGTFSALRLGIGLLGSGLLRTGFYAAWGVGQFGALALASGKWIYNTIIGTGQAIRGMLIYIRKLVLTNALYYRMAASIIWANIVSGQLWTNMIRGITRWISLLSLSNLKLAAHRVLFYASWGVGQIVSAVAALGAYVLGLNFAAIGQSVLNTLMLKNPVGLIIVGVTALITAFYGLYKLTDWMFPNFFKGIKEYFGKAWDYIYNTFVKPLVGVFKWLGDITGISAAFSVDTNAGANNAENDSLFKSLGVDPNAPGMNAQGKNTGGLGISKAMDANVQGDRSIKHFTINIQKQVENMVFNTIKDTGEISSKVRREVERVMLDAVNEVNYSN